MFLGELSAYLELVCDLVGGVGQVGTDVTLLTNDSLVWDGKTRLVGDSNSSIGESGRGVLRGHLCLLSGSERRRWGIKLNTEEWPSRGRTHTLKSGVSFIEFIERRRPATLEARRGGKFIEYLVGLNGLSLGDDVHGLDVRRSLTINASIANIRDAYSLWTFLKPTSLLVGLTVKIVRTINEGTRYRTCMFFLLEVMVLSLEDGVVGRHNGDDTGQELSSLDSLGRGR